MYKINGDTATLFMLDSANAYFGKEQLDWLEKELRTARGRVFVFTHFNLFVNGVVNIQQLRDPRERARIIKMLQGRCDIMFMGHSHRRLIEKFGGVQYINIEDFVSTQIYCLITVTKTTISYEFKKLLPY
jgi:predicted phosphodiesterase